MMILTALLGIGFIFALAGDFVLWAKLDEQRKATAEAEDRRWDEISLRLNVEKELEQEKKYFHNADAESAENYQDAKEARMKCRELQDKLSTLLCPRNDHVRKDGCCVKCGRVKDD